MNLRASVFISTFILLGLICKAEVKLPALFSDNMVLQQKTEVNIWGWADKGKEIIVTTSWDSKEYLTKTDKNGIWKLKVNTPEAGGPFEVKVSDGEEIVLKNVLIGEVWLCSGQSNMEMPMKGFFGQPVNGSNNDILKSKNSNIHFISVPRSVKTVPQNNFKGTWESASPESVSNFSATAYYYAQLLQELLGVPVGLIEVSYGGSCVEAWTSKEHASDFNGVPLPEIADSSSSSLNNRTPTTLFNGMINPVIGYTIKGAIWYQGETNNINSELYAERFAVMVKEWRDLWGQGEFPFYYTQIAPYDYSIYFTIDNYKEKNNSAYLREAQLNARETIPNSEMAVLMDIGEEKNIHPKDKKTSGERLAYIALSKTYNLTGIGYAPPIVKGMEMDGNTVVVSFDNIPNGISSFGKEVTCFEIAGSDKKFYPAQAWVRSKSVVLSSPKVKEPVAVRYAFKDFIVGQLFSTEGIPVPSFRTDNW